MYDTSGHTSSQPNETTQQDTRTLTNNDEGSIEELIDQALPTTTSDTSYFNNYRDLYDLTSILRDVKDTKRLHSQQTIDNMSLILQDTEKDLEPRRKREQSRTNTKRKT